MWFFADFLKNHLFWQLNGKIHIKMCICAICLQSARCAFINYCRLMWLFIRRNPFLLPLMTLCYSKRAALCCFTASLVTSAVFGTAVGGEGHLSKLRWSLITYPQLDKICATQHACFMMSVTRHSELQNISTNAVCAFACISSILILMQGLWFSLFWLYQDMFMV